MQCFWRIGFLLAVLGNVIATPTRRICIVSGETSNDRNQYNQDSSDEYYEDAVTEEPTFQEKDNLIGIECPKQSPYCYTLWILQDPAKNNSLTIVRQGCWESTDKENICENSECVSTNPIPARHFFCCCSTDNCNANFTKFPELPLNTNFIDGAVVNSNVTPLAPYTSIWSSPTLYICITIGVILIMLIIGLLTFRMSRKSEPELSPLAPSGPGYSSNLYNVDNLKLVAMIGQGKYGTVWKGIVNEQPVAVKIFSAQNKEYFHNEKDMYLTPLMESPALLSYFGCDERRTMDDRIEYLLVLSLAPLGCLQDWLIENKPSYIDFCRMGKSVARGLSHLHTELKKGDLSKPCICHRDLNSRNILVKPDLTCCICDLGFALKAYGPRYECKGEMALAETKSINEVGTLRYMAPEVLEGAVNLRECESALKQIDVYSLGLVLWELSVRCPDFYPTEQATPSYKAPYEQEVGTNPSFEQMQVLVSRHKARPLFPPLWGGSLASKIIRDTCEDCWDHDAEARLTSLCVEERLQEVSTMKPKAMLNRGNSPPLSTNNYLNPPAMLQNMHSTSPTVLSFTTPPNQQIIPQFDSHANIKNRDIFTHQIHPFQGRNPCQERNLAPQNVPNYIIIDKGQRHHNINSNYIPSEIIVDEENELVSPTNELASIVMGEGIPKQFNVDTADKRINGLKAMLTKKFQKSDPFCQPDCEDTSNLVEQKMVYKAHHPDDGTHVQINMITNRIEKETNLKQMHNAERPSNLDLSPKGESYEKSVIRMNRENSKLTEDLTNQTFTVIQPDSPENKLRIVISKSANAVKNLNSSRNSLLANEENKFLKRQRSLEVFREVFGSKGSIERLRDPSQRVKTPGDVPPSVRKVRASKTLSLYDDRMMGASHLANSV